MYILPSTLLGSPLIVFLHLEHVGVFLFLGWEAETGTELALQLASRVSCSSAVKSVEGCVRTSQHVPCAQRSNTAIIKLVISLCKKAW